MKIYKKTSKKNSFEINLFYFLLLIPGIVMADEVYLKNGATIKGVVVENGEKKVCLEVDSGKIILPKEDISDIKLISLDENNELRKKWLANRDADAQVKMEEKTDINVKKTEEVPVIKDVKGPADEKAQPRPAYRTIKNNINNSYYLIAAPYPVDQTKKIPLIIGFHGYTRTPEEFMEFWKFEGGKRGYIVACLKSIDQDWGERDIANVLKMLEEIKKNYIVDEQKILLTGFSAGANFSFYLGLNFPEKFTAIAAVAGSINKARIFIGNVFCSNQAGKHIPVLMIIGNKEEPERIEFAWETKNELEKYGYPLTYKVIPNVAHSYMSWYSKTISEWFREIAKPR